MKKILFGLQTMVMGGVEKELIAILKHLNPNEWDVTLVLMYVQDRSVVDMIPPEVKVINLNIDRAYYCSDTLTMAKLRWQGKRYGEAASLLIKKALQIGQTGSNVCIDDIPGISGTFDTAVCFHIHSPLMVRYIADKVSAKTKLAWIHNDFTTSGYRVDKIKDYLSAYNRVIGVSAKITNEFMRLCPSLASKTKVVYNALDSKEIQAKAKEHIDISVATRIKGKFVLLTVGRLEEQKGYDIAIEAANVINREGIDFIWCVIGDGSKKTEIQSLISEYGLEERFMLLGRKDNPYSYMNLCDIYVQPSRHEGYPLTVLEAKILAKPIVCTNFAGADEQIKNGVNGLIVPLNDSVAVADAIINLFNNYDRQRLFASVLFQENVFNQGFSEITSCL